MHQFHSELSDLHRDHEPALTLAGLCRRASSVQRARERASTWREAVDGFEHLIESHVAVVERLLLPQLAVAGERELVERARLEYAELHSAMAGLSCDRTSLTRLAIAVERIVVLEKVWLFPRAGRRLSAVALAAIGAASERRRAESPVAAAAPHHHAHL